jgi:tRNA dimethylallyltransferase
MYLGRIRRRKKIIRGTRNHPEEDKNCNGHAKALHYSTHYSYMRKIQAATKKPKLLVIVGPTASGKTALSIELAKEFNGEVVSADSCQIYRGMDIGTGKPQLANRARLSSANIRECVFEIDSGITHHLIDIKNPDEPYTVAEFKRDALRAINAIIKRGKLPILIGGTGLYVKAVVENLDIPRVQADAKLRERLEREMNAKGLDHLMRRLVALDPEAAYIVDPKNPRRVIRALEIALTTGKPFSAQRSKGKRLFDTLQLGITLPKEVLCDRIATRIDQMFKDGLVDEVKKLVKKYGEDQKAFDAIGYREVIEYLDGKTSLEECAAKMKLNTWHYARRQMTWFRKDKTVHWIKNSAEAFKLAARF